MEPARLLNEVESKPIGYARFEIKLDQSGLPLDPKFIEVNTDFETYFKTTFKELRGISKYELFDDFYKDHKEEWSSLYYQVAFENKTCVRVIHFKPTGLSFEMTVYSPAHGQFICAFKGTWDWQTNKADDSIKKELEEAHNKISILVNATSDGINTIDDNGIILDVNEGTLRMTGYKKEELIGQFIGKLDRNVKNMQECKNISVKVRDRGLHVYERIHTHKNGTQIPVEINSRILNLNGQEISFSIVRDITQRKRQKSRFREIIKQAPYGIALIDNNGLACMVNQSLIDMFGYEEKELMEIPFDKFSHEDDVTEGYSVYHQRLIDEGKKRYSIEKRYLKKNGKTIYANLVVCLINDPYVKDGRKGLLMFQDITEKVERQNKMAQQIQELKMVLKTGRLIAFEADFESGRIKLFRNEVAIDNKVFPVDKLKSLDSFISAIRKQHRGYCLRKIESLRKGKITSFSCEFQILRGDKYNWQEATITLLNISNDQRPRMFVIVKNVEEQKNNETTELVGQEKERIRIARDIHDSIGQMLVGTRMMIKTGDIKRDDEMSMIDGMLEDMIKESRMIINNFGTGLGTKQTLKDVFYNLAEKMKRVYIGEIKILWQGEDSISNLKVATNIFRIYQEALTNSIKYSRSKSIVINVRNYDYFFMDIIDYGIGFDIKRAFQGFGMQNMKDRAGQVGATIDIDTTMNSGTVIRFRY